MYGAQGPTLAAITQALCVLVFEMVSHWPSTEEVFISGPENPRDLSIFSSAPPPSHPLHFIYLAFVNKFWISDVGPYTYSANTLLTELSSQPCNLFYCTKKIVLSWPLVEYAFNPRAWKAEGRQISEFHRSRRYTDKSVSKNKNKQQQTSPRKVLFYP